MTKTSGEKSSNIWPYNNYLCSGLFDDFIFIFYVLGSPPGENIIVG